MDDEVLLDTEQATEAVSDSDVVGDTSNAAAARDIPSNEDLLAELGGLDLTDSTVRQGFNAMSLLTPSNAFTVMSEGCTDTAAVGQGNVLMANATIQPHLMMPNSIPLFTNTNGMMNQTLIANFHGVGNAIPQSMIPVMGGGLVAIQANSRMGSAPMMTTNQQFKNILGGRNDLGEGISTQPNQIQGQRLVGDVTTHGLLETQQEINITRDSIKGNIGSNTNSSTKKMPIASGMSLLSQELLAEPSVDKQLEGFMTPDKKVPIRASTTDSRDVSLISDLAGTSLDALLSCSDDSIDQGSHTGARSSKTQTENDDLEDVSLLDAF